MSRSIADGVFSSVLTIAFKCKHLPVSQKKKIRNRKCRLKKEIALLINMIIHE